MYVGCGGGGGGTYGGGDDGAAYAWPDRSVTTIDSPEVARRKAMAIADLDRAGPADLLGLPQGNYVVEISRASGGTDAASSPIRGEVTLRLGGEVRKVPFTLSGARAEVGTVRVSFTARLVPIEADFSWRNGGLR